MHTTGTLSRSFLLGPKLCKHVLTELFIGGLSSKIATPTTTKTRSSSKFKTATTKWPNEHGLSAHYSRYIWPDAYRIGVSDNELLSSAYVNADGSYVVVVLNPNYEARKIAIDLGKCSGVKKVKAYSTDQENNMEEVEVSFRRGVATAHLTSRGLLTLKTEWYVSRV